MKKHIIFSIFLSVFLLWPAMVISVELPKPFEFEVGKSAYEKCLEIVKSHDWKYQEYEKKQFKRIEKDSPDRGKNTFMQITPKNLEGAKGIRLFFNNNSILDAVIVILEPNMFVVVMDELDSKYKLVKKNLMGEDFTENYTSVLWEKKNVYIELQQLSAHFVRLLYVEKVLFENYKDFLFKPYESFRRKQIKPDWIGNL